MRGSSMKEAVAVGARHVRRRLSAELCTSPLSGPPAPHHPLLRTATSTPPSLTQQVQQSCLHAAQRALSHTARPAASAAGPTAAPAWTRWWGHCADLMQSGSLPAGALRREGVSLATSGSAHQRCISSLPAIPLRAFHAVNSNPTMASEAVAVLRNATRTQMTPAGVYQRCTSSWTAAQLAATLVRHTGAKAFSAWVDRRCTNSSTAAPVRAFLASSSRRVFAADAAAVPVTYASAKSAAAAATAAKASSALSSSLLVHGTRGVQMAVAGWLFGSAAWTFAMVVLGGVTRLTRSGLSMTDWKFTGGLPPLTDAEWEAEFEKYKQYPEYKRVNKGISLEDFKFIYWMEYAHRMWGRALGVLFIVPFTYFLARGALARPLVGRLGLLFALGGAQGFVGWWMVKSGLEEPEDRHAVPRVSPYRLAAHLTSAFIIYSLILWTGLTVAMPHPPMETLAQIAAAAKARVMAHNVAALVGVTAFSGAFVAGNDAGRAFNTFPMMGDHWVPPGILELTPVYKNFFENTATVQFQHRLLALSTLGAMALLYARTRKLPLHPSSKLLVDAALGVTALQVTLGVTTVLTYVPVSLGSAHQAGALTLFTVLLLLLHSLRRPRGAAAVPRAASHLNAQGAAH